MSAIRRGEKHARAYEQCGDDEENFMKKIIAVMIVGLLATPGIAQMQGMDHSKMDMGQMMKPTRANPYPSAEKEMHQTIKSAMRADATETWARKMAGHHRDAIAMSRHAIRAHQHYKY